MDLNAPLDDARMCAPCVRGACEECHAVDHPDMPGLYACPHMTGGACPRPTGPAEIGHDYGIPTLSHDK
ncbi:hypothetical protein [Salinactinospora qingdaonensis]|uniref:Uncharacterized protein n=1 Tax=Salinactinospora qingdaonensis TaxID=702744 RepID=A0ABP7F539_9ACTN